MRNIPPNLYGNSKEFTEVRSLKDSRTRFHEDMLAKDPHALDGYGTMIISKRLEDIGFYTLSDYRASQCSVTSPLWRCELLLTDRCNFHCPYCRGLRRDCKGDMPLQTAINVINHWVKEGLKNVRFSGGEPTLYPDLMELVYRCKFNKVEHIAVSTNGSNSTEYYEKLVEAGVNDLSISLDSGCCSIGDKMTGGIKGSWDKVVDNIRKLSLLTYVSVGMVFTPENFDTCIEDVMFTHSLGVSDIRVIPSAQYNKALLKLKDLPTKVLSKYPILKYRVDHIRTQTPTRGIQPNDTHKCPLVLDDMAIAGKWHFPCIIYLREGGEPIGEISPWMRVQRQEWYEKHDTHTDRICLGNCLDVCRDYNNKVCTPYKGGGEG